MRLLAQVEEENGEYAAVDKPVENNQNHRNRLSKKSKRLIW